jgi:hypothetical protein
MLISEYVDVMVVGGTLEYYSKLFENIKVKDIIKVHISNLPDSSQQNIQVKCDTCGKIVDFKFKNYKKYRSDYLNAIYECRECEIDRIWNNVLELCNELDFKILSDKAIYKNQKSRIKFICNKHQDYGIQDVAVNELLNKKYGCKLCTNEKRSKAHRLDYDKFVKPLFKSRGYILLDNEYINAKQPLKYICSKHPHEIKIITYEHLRTGKGCMDCAKEKVSEMFRQPFYEIETLFKEKELILLDTEYINQTIPMRYLCPKHIDKGEQTITVMSLKVSDFGCKYCAIEYRAMLKSKGGITPLHNYIRGKINQWNEDSMKACNYKCVLSGKRFDTVHHLYGFNTILFEALEILDLPIYDMINKYSNEELNNIEIICLELHYKYGLGVCLSKPIHDLFHKIYSKGDNTPEQFEEFSTRYRNFEFDELLENKYKNSNIKMNN